MNLLMWRDGWYSGCSQRQSPHCDARPRADDVSLLVIHNISLPPHQYGGAFVEQLFMGTLDCKAHPYFAQLAGVRVSAHFFLRRNGELLQFVSTDMRAWHAGVSNFQGRAACNDYSLGIELEGCDDQPFADIQYIKLAEISRILIARYPALTRDRIVGHEHIAPGRKTDPGPAFDWDRYRLQLVALRS